ncbi:MAG: hypothetical protein JWM72_1553, partial [Actinomycetia bacterium]|nr:hypothetical protein [Actinomycetes bacterium]
VEVVAGSKWIEPDDAAQALRDAYNRAKPILDDVVGE